MIECILYLFEWLIVNENITLQQQRLFHRYIETLCQLLPYPQQIDAVSQYLKHNPIHLHIRTRTSLLKWVDGMVKIIPADPLTLTPPILPLQLERVPVPLPAPLALPLPVPIQESGGGGGGGGAITLHRQQQSLLDGTPAQLYARGTNNAHKRSIRRFQQSTSSYSKSSGPV